jgi:Xaa-Pro aminopeptidase
MLGNGVYNRIAAALGALPPEVDELARDLAKIRTAEELTAAGRAAAIAERGYGCLLEIARPGMREVDLAAEVHWCMKRLGAEDMHLLLSASPRNLSMRPAGERVIEVGDIVLSEISPCYRGQFVQICRTTVIGEPHPSVCEKFDRLQNAMRQGVQACHAGAPMADVERALGAASERTGFHDFSRPPCLRVRGQGSSSHRREDVVEPRKNILDSGTVLVLQPHHYIRDGGLLTWGDTVVVAATCARPLSVQSAQLDFVAV